VCFLYACECVCVCVCTRARSINRLLSFVPSAFDGETPPKARLPYGRFVVVQFSGRRPVSRITLVRRRVVVPATGHRRIVAAPQKVQEVRLGLHFACNTRISITIGHEPVTRGNERCFCCVRARDVTFSVCFIPFHSR